MTLNKLSFKQLLLLLIILPLLGYLIFATINLSEKLSLSSQMKDLEQMVSLAEINSLLVHELQKERGATAGFLGSKGKKFTDTLAKQRQLTDRANQQRDQFLSEHDFSYHSDIQRALDTIKQQLNELGSIRNQVDNFSIALTNALGYYTTSNKQLLNISADITHFGTNAKINTMLTAYFNFLQGKERAGIERAVLANTFSADKFSPGMYEKFVTLVDEQDIFEQLFLLFATKADGQYYQQTMQDDSVRSVQSMRKIAADNNQTGAFGIDSSEWFKQATNRINLLKKVEDHLNKSLKTSITQLGDNTFSGFIFTLLLALVLLILLTLCVFCIFRILDRQISNIYFTLHAATHQHDLANRVRITSNNDLGQIATDINALLDIFSNTIRDMAHSSDELAANSLQASTAIQESEALINDQQLSTSQIAAAIEEMVATAKEIATRIVSASDNANQARQLTEQGKSTVHDSGNAIKSLAKDVTVLSERISNLHQSSTTINKMLDIIKSIAEQTNLLALNAAIEAARAGEQGRGFAVVADEVRTLAQRTQDSTTEIEQIINQLQTDANNAYELTEASHQKTQEVVERSDNVIKVLDNISNSIIAIDNVTDQIATAAEEQVSVNEEISRNVVSVEQKSQETLQCYKQIIQTSESQSRLSKVLGQLSATFKI